MPQTIREAVAVFDEPETLDEAVYALETQGFDRAAFSLLADEATIERKLAVAISVSPRWMTNRPRRARPSSRRCRESNPNTAYPSASP
jgi:hypothetical protein